MPKINGQSDKTPVGHGNRHKSQISSIDFVINRFFMKMFNTNNIEIVKCCQQEFCFSLPSVTLARRTEFF